MPAELPVCTLCGRSREQHTDSEGRGAVHHRFAAVEGSLEALTDRPRVKEVSGPPADVLLRTILLEKGVITLDDIQKAETLLRGTGVIRNRGDSSD